MLLLQPSLNLRGADTETKKGGGRCNWSLQRSPHSPGLWDADAWRGGQGLLNSWPLECASPDRAGSGPATACHAHHQRGHFLSEKRGRVVLLCTIDELKIKPRTLQKVQRRDPLAARFGGRGLCLTGLRAGGSTSVQSAPSAQCHSHVCLLKCLACSHPRHCLNVA